MRRLRLSRSASTISVGTARSRHPALVPLLSRLVSSYEQLTVKEAGPLPRSVARSKTRGRRGKNTSFRLVDGGVLIDVPMGTKVSDAADGRDPSLVVQIDSAMSSSRGRRARKVAASTATVIIYSTDAG